MLAEGELPREPRARTRQLELVCSVVDAALADSSIRRRPARDRIADISIAPGACVRRAMGFVTSSFCPGFRLSW